MSLLLSVMIADSMTTPGVPISIILSYALMVFPLTLSALIHPVSIHGVVDVPGTM